MKLIVGRTLYVMVTVSPLATGMLLLGVEIVVPLLVIVRAETVPPETTTVPAAEAV